MLVIVVYSVDAKLVKQHVVYIYFYRPRKRMEQSV